MSNRAFLLGYRAGLVKSSGSVVSSSSRSKKPSANETPSTDKTELKRILAGALGVPAGMYAGQVGGTFGGLQLGTIADYLLPQGKLSDVEYLARPGRLKSKFGLYGMLAGLGAGALGGSYAANRLFRGKGNEENVGV